MFDLHISPTIQRHSPSLNNIIFLDANVQGLSGKEIKELQSLAFDSVHKVMQAEFNDSEIRYSEKRFSDRGVGDDVMGHHGDVPKQRIMIPNKRFPRVPLKEVSRGFQAMELPDKFEDYDVTDVDGRISLKELMKVTGTVENLMEAFAAFDKDGKWKNGQFYFILFYFILLLWFRKLQFWIHTCSSCLF